jgi:hypothetical protein
MKKPTNMDDGDFMARKSQPMANTPAPEQLRARLQECQSAKLHRASHALRKAIEYKERQNGQDPSNS